MRKIACVCLAVLVATAAPALAFDSWGYYKGIGGDSWGVSPDSVSTDYAGGSWTVNQSGNNRSENGVLWGDFSGTGAANQTVSFTVVTGNLPIPFPWGNGEFAGSGQWTEVYVYSVSAAGGGTALAQSCMSGSGLPAGQGGWKDHLTSTRFYNPYFSDPGNLGGAWRETYTWTNDPAFYQVAGNGPGGLSTMDHGMHYAGAEGTNPRINNAYQMTVNLTGMAPTDKIFIGVKTGLYNAGTNSYSGGAYSQGVYDLTITPEPCSLLLLGLGGLFLRRRR